MGRPIKYTIEELQTLIDSYFVDCEKDKKIPNKAGMRIKLDIVRDTFNEWRHNQEKGFSDAIKKAEQRIEEAWVQRLNYNAATGAIFYLKNAFKDDYKDRTETDITSGGEPIAGFQYVKPKRENT
ncbi:MAG TPA: terminase small subunit [Candidatus Dojkabacteria bacterium]